jgi:nucleoside-diphosphate-sugar epimerase
MKVLFTGGSSFTGYWFVRELVRSGHEVVAILRRPVGSYDGQRAERVARLGELCECVAGVSFGDEGFLDLIARENRWDLLCHHAAHMTNYKSPDFDVISALAANTANLRAVLRALGDRYCRKLIVTGSVFETGEGAGSEGLRAFSPYGLSKTFTWELIRHYAGVEGFRIGKFVIANPFGPFEEERFTSHLVRTWASGEAATVNTPEYVRDNIHVSLLAKAYAQFAEGLRAEPGVERLGPRGYVESQGAFAERFAKEIGPRLDLRCELVLRKQMEFPEPRVRVNVDILDARKLGWREEEAWDELASFYRGKAKKATGP